MINDQDPVAAFTYDMEQLVKSDVLFAVLDEPISAGVQLEIGWANAKGMKTVFAHQLEYKLPWVNATMVQAGLASEILLPLDGRASGNVLRLNDAAAISR